MRKALALILISGSLAAAVPAAFAMEREQPISRARPVTTLAATETGATAGTAGTAGLQQPEHEKNAR
jgi:hypothetical protein